MRQSAEGLSNTHTRCGQADPCVAMATPALAPPSSLQRLRRAGCIAGRPAAGCHRAYTDSRGPALPHRAGSPQRIISSMSLGLEETSGASRILVTHTVDRRTHASPWQPSEYPLTVSRRRLALSLPPISELSSSYPCYVSSYYCVTLDTRPVLTRITQGHSR
jgi:hypothetical protein